MIGPLLLILLVLFIVGVGVLAIVGVLKSKKSVDERPETLAKAGAPLGLQKVPDPIATATWAFQGTLLQETPEVAAVVQGQTTQGHVTVVDRAFTSGGRIHHANVETIAIYYGTSGLPRLIIQPSGHDHSVEGLRSIDFSEEEDEALAAFGFSYSVHMEDIYAVRSLMTPTLAAFFDRLDDAGKAPVIEVLPDRILFFRPRTGVEPSALGAFLAEGMACIHAMMGAMSQHP